MPSILVIAPTPVPIFCTTSKTTSKSVLTQFSQFVHDISYIHTISGKQHLKKPRPIIDHPCSPTWDSPAWFRAEGFKANPAGQLNCLPVRFSKGCKQPSMSVFSGPTGDGGVGPFVATERIHSETKVLAKGNICHACRVTSWKLSTW